MPEITGILLAAGLSRRFGSDKRLHQLPDGRPLALAAAITLQAGMDQTLAVLRPEDAPLSQMLVDAGLQPVFCPQATLGMGASIACGVRASPDAGGWLIALADMPFIQPDTIRLIAESLRQGAPLVAPLYQGRRGHPVGFGPRFRKDLLALDGDSGARAILQAHPELLRTLAVDDPGILRDIDAPADLPPA
ncbi:nucleotidyltransferase family protein [Thermithiobacillus plumbiphilus]|uniref:Nucleotidyltransferase family protein n=1 Tax=Thermithiobacillus plumbiphilus TaxID=1729899 RepID=A0ABU9D7R2_9PROT